MLKLHRIFTILLYIYIHNTIDTYSHRLQDLVREMGEKLGYGDRMRNGVYCFVSGPAYESKAESAFLRERGDCVGMSTIPEVL